MSPSSVLPPFQITKSPDALSSESKTEYVRVNNEGSYRAWETTSLERKTRQMSRVESYKYRMKSGKCAHILIEELRWINSMDTLKKERESERERERERE